MRLQKKVALVTGASGDIGGAISLALAAQGCHIVGTCVDNMDGLERLRVRIQELGVELLAVRLDYEKEESINAAVAAACKAFGRIDVLINNAAWNIGIPFPRLDDLTPAIWDRVFGTNVRGPFLLSRACAEQLKQHKGAVVNIASIAGLYPFGSSVAYSSSKAALIQLTKCLAVALAPDVRVNAIAPGLVEESRMGQRVPEDLRRAAKEKALLKTGASLNDIADQVVLLCCSESITGQTVVIDGGMIFH